MEHPRLFIIQLIAVMIFSYIWLYLSPLLYGAIDCFSKLDTLIKDLTPSYIVVLGIMVFITYLPWNLFVILFLYESKICSEVLTNPFIVCMESLLFGLLAMKFETVFKYPSTVLVLTSLFIFVIFWLIKCLRSYTYLNAIFIKMRKQRPVYSYIINKTLDNIIIYILVFIGMSIVFLL